MARQNTEPILGDQYVTKRFVGSSIYIILWLNGVEK